MAAQAALLQTATPAPEDEYSDYTYDGSDSNDKGHTGEQVTDHDSEVEDMADMIKDQGGLLMPKAAQRQSKAPASKNATEASKTARMNQKVSFMVASESAPRERTAKSSTRQKRPPRGFALPTFSNETGANHEFEMA